MLTSTICTKWSQARRWEDHEAHIVASDLSIRGNHIWLVRHSLAEGILQFWIWSLQHVMEEDGCVGSSRLPLGECRPICLRRLDSSRPNHPGFHRTQLPYKNIHGYILLQLCHQAYPATVRPYSSFWDSRNPPYAFHQSVADEPVEPPSRHSTTL